MNGVHDIGGMHGFGPVAVEEDEEGYHAPWQGRVAAMASLVRARGLANLDAFRHAIERLPPADYLALGYFERWIAVMERLLAESESLDPAAAGYIRSVARPPRFAVGQRVRARNLHPAGHTRLPHYARGRLGVVHRVRPACIFPDTHAHGRGESPQHLYSIRFNAQELWGDAAEPGAAVHLDLFEPYLEEE